MLKALRNLPRLLAARGLFIFDRLSRNDPTRARILKREAKWLAIKLFPTFIAAFVALLLAQLYFRPEEIPTGILVSLLGFFGLVAVMLIWPRITPAVVVLGSSIILASGIVNTPPAKLVAGFFLIILFALIVSRLEVGVFFIVVIGTSIFHQSVIPKPFTVGNMGFGIIEVITVFMLITTMLYIGSRRELNKLKNPIAFWILLLFASIVLSITVAYVKHKDTPWDRWTFTDSYNAIRPMFLYLLFIAISAGIRSRKQLKNIIIIVLLVATIVSVLMPVQYFLGTKVKIFFGTTELGPRVEELSEEDTGVTRSLPPGMSIISMFLPLAIYLACIAMTRKRNLLLFVASALIIGLLFSFTRSQWVAMFVSLIIIWLLSDRVIKKQLILATTVISLVSILAGLAIITIMPGEGGAKFKHALSTRFMSIFEKETVKSGSIQSRFEENEAAKIKLKEDPIFGIGAGNPLRYVTATNIKGSFLVPVFEMHNSYLEVWLVLGLLGLVSVIGLSITFLIRCYMLLKTAKDPLIQAIAIGSLSAYVGFLMKCTISMMIIHEPFSIISAALIFGITEAAWRLNMEENQSHTTDKPDILAKVPQRLKRIAV